MNSLIIHICINHGRRFIAHCTNWLSWYSFHSVLIQRAFTGCTILCVVGIHQLKPRPIQAQYLPNNHHQKPVGSDSRFLNVRGALMADSFVEVCIKSWRCIEYGREQV